MSPDELSCSGQLPIEASEQLAALIDQRRQMGLDETPDKLVVDGDVLVGELVAEADDLWCLLDLAEQGLITLRELREHVTDDDDSRSTEERIRRLLQ